MVTHANGQNVNIKQYKIIENYVNEVTNNFGIDKKLEELEDIPPYINEKDKATNKFIEHFWNLSNGRLFGILRPF